MTYYLMLHITPLPQLSHANQTCQHSFGSFFCYQPIQLLFIYWRDIYPFTWTHFLFIPRHINWPEVSADIYDFSQRMRWAEYFFDENSNNRTANEHDTPFHNKSTWNPPNDRERALNTFLDAVKLDITTTKPKPTQDNLTVTQRQAIGQLKQRQDIIIKPADKGSTIVMDKTWYIDECNRQLTDQILPTPRRRHHCRHTNTCYFLR